MRTAVFSSGIELHDELGTFQEIGKLEPQLVRKVAGLLRLALESFEVREAIGKPTVQSLIGSESRSAHGESVQRRRGLFHLLQSM